MFEQHVRQLSGADPAQRKQAIHYLARSGEARSISVLAQHIDREIDPELKVYAQKGLQYARTRLAQPSAAKPMEGTTFRASKGLSGSGSEALTNRNVTRPSALPADKHPISAANQTKARNLLTRAISAQMAGQSPAALSDFKSALKLDPALAQDQSARSLATALVGGSDADRALALIIEGFKIAPTGNGSRNLIESLLEFMLVLIIVSAINVAGTFAMDSKYKEFRTVLLSFIDTAQRSPLKPEQAKQLTDIKTSLSAPQPAIINTATTNTIQFLVGALLYGTVLWIAGRMIGGQGDWFAFQAVNLFLTALLGALVNAAIYFTPIAAFAAVIRLREVSQLQSLFLSLAGLLLGYSVISTWLLARVHRFGIGKGYQMQSISFAFYLGVTLLIFLVLRNSIAIPGLSR